MKAKKNPVVDIGRNSSIYFAIGLNIMLFFTWQALEIKTYKADQDVVEIINIQKQFEEEIPIVNVNTPPPPPPPASVHESIKIVEDAVEIEETVIESSEIGLEDAVMAPIPVAVEAVEVEEIEEDVQVPFAVIEHVPVFPGCEQGTNDEKIACFQEKMKAHISKHFRYPQSALDLGVQGRVSVVFIIDANGKIASIRSRGPDKTLEKEAERIIGLLPDMIPGKQRGKPVKVSYAVPIFFKYESR
ncbi:energy transducer TonB [Tamlana haliotis]|uniref:Energy transducer TonB n=1 Tax=Pseudotamlana haliotis TaxID=2614804 RepID=A0A6N6MJR2_9FLAO|nr:energy transducer TonB [Tamlana haliotis]KAB1069085.1 energy transducer TonB [Tamlana haliotis]